MIKVSNVSKSFDGFLALDKLDINVAKGSIYGLVGTNGAGKTTIIKHLTGVLKADSGEITMDGENVYDNEGLKKRVGYIPDDLYFFNSYTLKEMSRFYKELFPNWDSERYVEMIKLFNLNEKIKLSRFSKGMQKQAAFTLTMSTKPDYLILDEPIDGLDPIIRKLVWKYIVNDVAEREMTVLVSSHNLREMEGICDSIGIIQSGKMVIEQELDELKSDIHKVQLAYPIGTDVDALFSEGPLSKLNVLHRENRGTVELVIIRDKREVVEEAVNATKPLVFDLLPLSLEEIFIYELGGSDNAIKDIVF